MTSEQASEGGEPPIPPAVDIHPGYSLRIGVPPVPAYRNIRSSAGLTPVTEAQASRVASGSWYGCYIVHSSTGEAVAMGRIIGDGGWYFHIADM